MTTDPAVGLTEADADSARGLGGDLRVGGEQPAPAALAGDPLRHALATLAAALEAAVDDSSTRVPSPSGVKVTSTWLAFDSSGSSSNLPVELPAEQQPRGPLVGQHPAPVALGALSARARTSAKQ